MDATRRAALETDLRDAPTDDHRLVGWVRRVALITRPDRVVWCDGSPGELAALTEPLLAAGALVHATPTAVVPAGLPGLPTSLAQRTFTATSHRVLAARGAVRDADALEERVTLGFEDCMRGRTMYVVPFIAGIGVGGTTSVGLQVTDSAYVAAALLTSYATVPASSLTAAACLLRAVHSVGTPLVTGRNRRRPDVAWPHQARPWAARFPVTAETWAFGTAYEPRLASVVGRPMLLAARTDATASVA